MYLTDLHSSCACVMLDACLLASFSCNLATLYYFTFILLIQLDPPVEGTGQFSTLHRLKFLILKNLASIAKEKDDTAMAVTAYVEVWL